MQLKEFESDSDVRVILIKGAGRAFCAGIDVNELKGKQRISIVNGLRKVEAPWC
jgi:short chain enoyl-CoA hydratase (EC 4.2.1.17)